jgi:two-component system OmpR family sensor kinase
VVALLAGLAVLGADAAGFYQLRSNLLHRVDQQLIAGTLGYSQPPPPGLHEPDPLGPRPRFLRNLSPGVMVTFYRADGTVEHTTVDAGADGAPNLGPYQQVRAHADGTPYTVGPLSGDDSWRVSVRQRGDGLVAVAISLRQVDATLQILLGIDLVVAAVMLVLLGLLAASVVRLGLAPLTAMQHTAQQIAAGDLSRRVPDVDPHTETGRLSIAFNAMLAQIEAALAARAASEQRLRQFLADASHELRTPLTSIQGFAELYRRGGTRPGPELDEAMTRIEAEAARMAVLVGDLLLLARLDQERPLQRRPVDLLTITADAVRDAHARVPGRFVTLDCDWPEDGAEPLIVPGDELRLRQVVNNLLTNALQHTPADAKVTVRVGRRVTEAGPATAAVGNEPASGRPMTMLEVTDTGPGLTADQAGRVFERLYRADASRQRASGGTGLGLAIVAAIVSAHGGRVELRTLPRRGTSFRVLLPAEEARPPDQRLTPPGPAEPGGHRSGQRQVQYAHDDRDRHRLPEHRRG